MTSRQNGDRFLRAIGRDVGVDEDKLHFDPLSRLLTLSGTGGRSDADHADRQAELITQVIDFLGRRPGASGTEISAEVRARSQDIRAAIQKAEEMGVVQVVNEGSGKAKRHYAVGPKPAHHHDEAPSGTEPRT